MAKKDQPQSRQLSYVWTFVAVMAVAHIVVVLPIIDEGRSLVSAVLAALMLVMSATFAIRTWPASNRS